MQMVLCDKESLFAASNKDSVLAICGFSPACVTFNTFTIPALALLCLKAVKLQKVQP